MSKENIIDHKEEAALAVAEEEKAKTQPEEGVYIQIQRACYSQQ